MHFHKKPGPIKPPRPRDHEKKLTMRELIIEVRDKLEGRLEKIEEILNYNIKIGILKTPK